MTKQLPLVLHGALHDPACPDLIVLDSSAWFVWVADVDHRSFRWVSLCGVFTARKERKQRGSWYWVAYRQVKQKLYKTYLGKSETLTPQARLCAAARRLATAAPAIPAPPQERRVGTLGGGYRR